MAAMKTIVITLPKNFGGFNKQNVSPLSQKLMVLPASNTQYQGQFLQQLVKSEPMDPSMGQDKPPRKRQKLDHLSMEEKIMRRKLKNRVAAQTARDRKKARMTELEALVAELEEENQQLINENKDLENRFTVLEDENDQLRERLGLGPNDVVVKEEPMPSESAVLKVSQQQGQALAHYMAAARCLTFLMTLSLTYFSGYSSNYKDQKSHLRPQLQLSHMEDRKQVVTLPTRNPSLRWWGPQQRNWNPSMNL